MSTRHPEPLARAYRVILALAGTCVGLLALVVLLALRPSGGLDPATALQDPEIRAEVVSRLVAENPGVSDSHSDADVGRLNMPNLEDHQTAGIQVSTNSYGMRESRYRLPKPAGVTRIVILGDSMVYAFGAAAEDRMGEHLRKWLEERNPGFEGRLECLHLGVPSWNIRSETAFLRRQLGLLRPDLVVQIIVPNDIDDTSGVRGFGVPSSFTPQHRQRADAQISAGFPRHVLGFRRQAGFLRLGLDDEAQDRYREAAEQIRRLARDVERLGGRYRLLVHYRQLLAVAWKQIGRHLDAKHVVYLSKSFGSDRQYTISRTDPHWNREGHMRVARLIYGLITRDGLLPAIDPPPWDEADRLVEEIAVAGRIEAERELDEDQVLALYRSPEISTNLDFAELDASTGAQIHGGLDREGRVSPYASLMLKNDGGDRLRILGSTFSRPELDGAKVRVSVDAEQVGELEIQADRAIDVTFPLPAATAGRSYLNVRLQSSDYVYIGPDLQHCVVFTLQRIAIEG